MICSPHKGSFSDSRGHIDKSHDDHYLAYFKQVLYKLIWVHTTVEAFFSNFK